MRKKLDFKISDENGRFQNLRKDRSILKMRIKRSVSKFEKTRERFGKWRKKGWNHDFQLKEESILKFLKTKSYFVGCHTLLIETVIQCVEAHLIELDDEFIELVTQAGTQYKNMLVRVMKFLKETNHLHDDTINRVFDQKRENNSRIFSHQSHSIYGLHFSIIIKLLQKTMKYSH